VEFEGMSENSTGRKNQGIKMGWLREHSALKVTPIQGRSASPFDELPIEGSLWDHDQALWERWNQRPAALTDKTLAQAVQEMQARAAQPRTRGRPGKLFSYKEYSRFYLQEWAEFIASQAHKMTQDQLAHLFNEAWDGANWRELLRADNRQYRMVYGVDKIVNDMGWNIRRCGCMVTIWARRHITQEEFEKIALQFSPQIHHTKQLS
jgi:hypothetical protein